MPSATSRVRRFLAASITGLIVANTAVIGATVFADGTEPSRASLAAPAATAPAVVITKADGTTVTIDPTTDEGKAAIAAAQERGETMTLTTVPVSTNEDGVTVAADGTPLLGGTAATSRGLPTDAGSLATSAASLLDAISRDVQAQTGVAVPIAPPTDTAATASTTPPTPSTPTTGGSTTTQPPAEDEGDASILPSVPGVPLPAVTTTIPLPTVTTVTTTLPVVGTVPVPVVTTTIPLPVPVTTTSTVLPLVSVPVPVPVVTTTTIAPLPLPL